MYYRKHLMPGYFICIFFCYDKNNIECFQIYMRIITFFSINIEVELGFRAVIVKLF